MSLKPNEKREQTPVLPPLPPPPYPPAYLHQVLLKREVGLKSKWHGRDPKPQVIYLLLS